MKSIFIVGLGIAVAGLTAFTIANWENESDKKNAASEKTTNLDGLASFPGKTIAFGKIYPATAELSFQVYGKNERPVTKEKLTQAKSLSNIVDYYPSNWIEKYESVEISSFIDGKEQKAVSKNQLLSAKQKYLLQSVDLANDLNITVKYKAKNDVSGNVEDNEINITLTIIPEKEAEFKGGYDEMIRYLKENSKVNTSGISPDLIHKTFIQFTVTENGEIADIDLKRASGNPEIDKRMFELIRDMPEWIPAENSKGKKVKQNFELALNFEFSFGQQGDGC